MIHHVQVVLERRERDSEEKTEKERERERVVRDTSLPTVEDALKSIHLSLVE